jgi:ankyrin
MAEEILEQGGSVSPILTIEPRRRKFHRAITLTMPLPVRARDQLRRERGDHRARFHRSQSPSVKKTVTPAGITVGPIGMYIFLN